jgi:anti-sigma factor RsiW
MSTQREPGSDELLHRFHDGELDGATRATVEASLAEDAVARSKVAALDEIGGLLRGAYGEEAAASFDAWPAIEAGLGRARVIPITSRLRRRAPLWISTLAVAAAVLAVLMFPWGGGGHPSNECSVDELEVTGASATIMKMADDSHGGSTTVLWLEE